MNNLLTNSKLFLKRNSSTVLTCIGGAGVVATAVMAVKATPKAITLLEQAKEEKGEKLTKFEVVQVAGPVYIPSIVMGAATLGCVFGANVLNKRQQASLASAYALVDNSYKEYKKKVQELYGDDAHQHVREEIAKDKYEDYEDEDEPDDGKELFYDDFSRRYFRATKMQVMQAEYRVNRDITMQGYARLNDFYEEMGVEPVDGGYELGWTREACLDLYWQEWVDFSHSKTVMDDGLECTIIYMLGEPVLDFEDYC